MKPVDLTKTLKPYKSGWVAINQKNFKVVAHTKSFGAICEKTKEKKNIFLMPASNNYFGFITQG